MLKGCSCSGIDFDPDLCINFFRRYFISSLSFKHSLCAQSRTRYSTNLSLYWRLGNTSSLMECRIFDVLRCFFKQIISLRGMQCRGVTKNIRMKTNRLSAKIAAGESCRRNHIRGTGITALNASGASMLTFAPVTGCRYAGDLWSRSAYG